MYRRRGPTILCVTHSRARRAAPPEHAALNSYLEAKRAEAARGINEFFYVTKTLALNPVNITIDGDPGSG
jgi:hypothetical protein